MRKVALALALSGALGAIAPALAQNPGTTNELPRGQGEKATPQNVGKTGEGPRGTPAAPSTNPGESSASGSSTASGQSKSR